jgi:hypothetical protein
MDGEAAAATPSDPAVAWQAVVDGLAAAGRSMAEQVRGLTAVEKADGYRALLRALNNQLGRFEVDRADPELLPFNGWREKMFMDNPDFLYWVADVDDSRSYRITGHVGDAVHTSITAYTASGIVDASAGARLDHASLDLDDAGRFVVTASRDRPASGTWLPLPDGANAIWVRGFYDDVRHDRHGEVRIEAVDTPTAAPDIEPDRFAHRLRRLGRGVDATARGIAVSVAGDLALPNHVRVWEEMRGGAAFTEPEIHYQRGAWRLAAGEALELVVSPVPCRYWNLMLYSRFLNSLDHRHRPVSLTGGRAVAEANGTVRVVLAPTDPSVPNWLDTEGREFGIFVLRWLQAEQPPELPALRVVALDSIRGAR